MSDSGLKFTVNDGCKQSVTTLVAYVDKFAMILLIIYITILILASLISDAEKTF